MSLSIFSEYKDSNYWNWNGFSIAWYVENENNNNIPLILLHGFGASKNHWRKNISTFANYGYAVYSLDLLGFGESDQPGINQIDRLDNGIWCDQVTDFINEIIRPINKKKVVIIGNSLGGLIALTCAVFTPEEISGIILSPLPDPVSLNFNKSIEKSHFDDLKINILKLLIRLIPIEFILFLINRLGFIPFFLKNAYFKNESIDKDLIHIIKKPSKRSTAARTLRAMCIGMTTRSNKLKSSFLLKIMNENRKVPLLLIWGEKDNFIPLFYGKRIPKLYPWVELKVVANSGHCVHDEDHNIFNNLSNNWIKELNIL